MLYNICEVLCKHFLKVLALNSIWSKFVCYPYFIELSKVQKDVISLLWYPNELPAGQNKYSYTFKGHSVFFSFHVILFQRQIKPRGKENGKEK